jgi:hypothetical protein
MRQVRKELATRALDVPPSRPAACDRPTRPAEHLGQADSLAVARVAETDTRSRCSSQTAGCSVLVESRRIDVQYNFVQAPILSQNPVGMLL